MILLIFIVSNIFTIIEFFLLIKLNIISKQNGETYLFIQSINITLFSYIYIYKDRKIIDFINDFKIFKIQKSDIILSFKYSFFFILIGILFLVGYYLIAKYGFNKDLLGEELQPHIPFHNGIRYFIYLIAYIVVGPIGEELFFRKICYGYLRNDKLKFLHSSILVSIFFALLHLSSFSRFLFTFILSMWLCYIYEKYNNINLNVLTHSFLNFYAILMAILMFIFS